MNTVVTGLFLLIAQFFIQPILQEKITSKSEKWLKKQDIFSKAAVVAMRRFDADNFNGPGSDKHIPIKNKPTSTEKNEILSQLYMISDDENIPQKFIEVVNNETSAGEIGNFIKMLRRELYGKDSTIDSNKMGVFYNIDRIE